MPEYVNTCQLICNMLCFRHSAYVVKADIIAFDYMADVIAIFPYVILLHLGHLDHCTTTGHDIKLENFTIVGKEDQNLKRAIKEAMYIRTNDPSLNRKVGKYHLPHIWDEVLFDTPELKLN